MTTPEVISRKSAMALGLTHYFTGKPCHNGHVAVRFVSAIACSVCLGVERKSRPRKAARPAQQTKEQKAQKRRDYYLSNCDKIKKSSSDWRRINKLKVRAHSSKRRAALRGNGGSHTEADVLEILLLQGRRCVYCPERLLGSDYEVDHVVPVIKGGSDNRSNLQILCVSCNKRKAGSDPVCFARKIGRLL